MEEYNELSFKNAIRIHKAMTEYRDNRYINLIQQVNTKTKEILTDNMGSQFVRSCGRDLAGELVRNFFDTSDYNITVDQLATRILEFNYDDDYDPLSQNGDAENIKKSVYNYNEITSSELKKISKEMDENQSKLFEKVDGKYKDANLMTKGKEEYANSKTNSDGSIIDEQTGHTGGRKKSSGDNPQNRQEVDHSQSANQATYNKKYITENGVDELKIMMNSADNFSMMEKSANASKGDVKVYEKDGKVLSPDAVRKEKEKIASKIEKETGKKPSKSDINEAFEKTTKNITSRATPEQVADAVCDRWENAENKQSLIDKGYLNKEGKVPKSVRKKVIAKVKHSQNVESVVILKHTKYGEVGKDAVKNTKAALGKIIAGQIIYYAAPPLVYEVKELVSKKNDLDSVLSKLTAAGKRITQYVLSKLKHIFKNVLFSSLKKFIKSFMDILINVVKATVKKLLKLAKNLVLAVVDAVKIIVDKNATAAQKADSVVNLFSITITSCVIEVLFEALAKFLNIPAPFDDIIFAPLQILTTVVCTNLVMLILQKIDLFDVRTGFKVNSIKQVFAEERDKYESDIMTVKTIGRLKIDNIIENVRNESINIYNQLQELDPKKSSVRHQLTTISNIFGMDINFEDEWMKFLGFNPNTQLV